MYYIELMQDVFFLLDILLQFNKGYYDKGALILYRPYIVRSYIKTWFLLDLLASFPYN